MEELWGEVAPVDPRAHPRARRAARASRASRWRTRPGHASHHVCYLRRATPATPTWATWPACACRRTSTRCAPTPPPDIDVDAWLGLDRPDRGLGARGPVPDPLRPLRGRARAARARRASRCAPRRAGRASSAPEEFAEWSEAETRAAVDAETAEALIQAAPPDQLGLGLRRYWDKVALRMSPETIEKPRTGGPGSGLGGDWRVIVLNDDHNTFDGVAVGAGARDPRGVARPGLRDRGPDPQHRPGDRLVGAEGAGRALLGAAARTPG